MRRAGLATQSHSISCQTILLTPYRIEKAKDLLHILEDAINLVRENATIGTTDPSYNLSGLLDLCRALYGHIL